MYVSFRSGLFLLFLSAIRHTEQTAEWTPRRHMAIPGNQDWALGAARNLSRYRSEFMQNWRKQHKSEPNLLGLDRFQMYQPIITCPPTMPIKRLGGDGDGGKLLCDPAPLRPGCIVYSLGSNNEFSFEESMLASTRCTVHTFDCTSPSKTLGPRHTFHPLCVGTRPNPAPSNVRQTSPDDYKHIRDIMHMMNHTRIDILKVDVEGFEMQLFEGWHESDILPDQLSVELHYSAYSGAIDTFDTPTQMAILFMHLSNLGYAAFAKELNMGSGCCSEYTFLRVEKPDLRAALSKTHVSRRLLRHTE